MEPDQRATRRFFGPPLPTPRFRALKGPLQAQQEGTFSPSETLVRTPKSIKHVHGVSIQGIQKSL